MSYVKSEYICPNCKKKNRLKIFTKLTEKNIKDVINKKIFTQKCKGCNTEIFTDYPTYLKTSKYEIKYTPGETKVEKGKVLTTTRVCDTFDDFKEKILIFEDELNDVLIEFIKSFILFQLSKEEMAQVDNIRYDSKNDEYLLFYLIGLKKMFPFSTKNYDSLLEKCKLKNINKMVMIDQYTYKKYIKI